MQGHLSNESVLRAEVAWGSLQTAGVIDKEQLGIVCSLDKQKTEAQVALFHANSETCVRLFNALLAGGNKDDVVRYVLAMLDEEERERAGGSGREIRNLLSSYASLA